MQRNYLRALLVCLIPCLLAGYAVAAALIRWDSDSGGFVVREGAGKFKLGIDLAGGTILVYEINTERTKQRKELQGTDAAALTPGHQLGDQTDDSQATVLPDGSTVVFVRTTDPDAVTFLDGDSKQNQHRVCEKD